MPCPHPGRGCDPAHGQLSQQRVTRPGYLRNEAICKTAEDINVPQRLKPLDLWVASLPMFIPSIQLTLQAHESHHKQIFRCTLSVSFCCC